MAGTIYTLTANVLGTRTQLNPNTQLPIAAVYDRVFRKY